MNIPDKIKALDWQPNGDAKAIYDEFLTNPDYTSKELLEKLLICLVYEEQYSDAIALAKNLIKLHIASFHTFLFYGIASDMQSDRHFAIWAYNEILDNNMLPNHMQSPTYSQFNIYGADREFIEFLINHSYTPENITNYIFREPFERIFHKERLLRVTSHFNVYYFPNSTAEKEIELFCTQREDAYKKIAEFMQFNKNIEIDIYLYEDSETKTAETGHTGAGWAYGSVIIEVYNAQQKVNPIHELVHIIAGVQHGYSVSAFSEGLAVYLCNLLNDNSMDDVVNGRYSDKVKQFYLDTQLFSLADLMTFQIGSVVSRPRISYPQAAAFVEYSISILGIKRFFELYSALKNDYTADGIEANILELEMAYGKKISDIEKCWIESIT